MSESEEEEEERIVEFPSISLEPDVMSIDSKRLNEDFHNESISNEVDIRPLNFRNCFKIGVSPQGKIFLPCENGELVAYSLDFDNTEAERALKIQIQELQPMNTRTEPVRYPFQQLEKYWTTLAKSFSGEDPDKLSVEAMMWSLFSVLFGDFNSNFKEIHQTNMRTEPEFLNKGHKELKRKKGLYNWLCEWTVNIMQGHDIGKNILNKILSGNYKESVKYACKSDHVILGNLLSMTNTNYFRELVKKQIDDWRTQHVFATFSKSIQDLYKMLSGDFEIANGLNWKQSLILLILFAFPKHEFISQIFEELDRAYQPTKPESLMKANFADISYLLLGLFSNPYHLSPDMFHPYNFQSHFSLGTSWLLRFSLLHLYEESPDFEEFNNSSSRNFFEDLDFLSSAFAEELVNRGEWEKAIYVLSFSAKSENMIKEILFRNAHLICTTEFLVGHVKLPVEWIDQAQALFDKCAFHFSSSFQRYIGCSEYYKAYELFMNEIGPDYIIKYSGEVLYQKLYVEVLGKIQPHAHQIAAWVLSGEVYIEYLSLALLFSKKVRPDYTSQIYDLIQKIEALFLPVLGLPKAVLKQKAALGIMQFNLNSWRLQLCEAKESLNLLSNYEKLQCTDFSQNEDLLRLSENLVYKYLKNL